MTYVYIVRNVHFQMCKVPENSSTAALQITAAERKHIFSLLFCTRVATSSCGDDINDKSPSWVSSFPVFINFEIFTSLCRPVTLFWYESSTQENQAVEYCVHTHEIHRCPWTSQQEAMVVWSSGLLCSSTRHPFHWATGCLVARGTTTSCYTQCSVGEKVTFLHHPLLSNTDIQYMNHSDSLTSWPAVTKWRSGLVFFDK